MENVVTLMIPVMKGLLSSCGTIEYYLPQPVCKPLIKKLVESVFWPSLK